MELRGAELERSIAEVVELALAEDIGCGDLTTRALFTESDRCRAQISLEEVGVVCGLTVVRAVFRQLDQETELETSVEDGERVERVPAELAQLQGRTRALLSGERVALNLLGRLSGIATLTRRFVDAVAGTGVAILDTRKTTPGLRELEKYAVRVGGGTNHRQGLYDAVLVKDNHLRLAGGVEEAVRRLRSAGSQPLELEADSLDQVDQALALGVERILLDNMTPAQVDDAVGAVRGKAELEVSGGVGLENVRAYAETGVDAISIGALTHSARSLDVSMEVLEP
ncbi:MAG: carboxylating nicotinate-nucleotide diphosphorylase [Gaiellaceae bacterium]|jgi:nicotinate-nucleotide pyrophosphorylase (carboxylating)